MGDAGNCLVFLWGEEQGSEAQGGESPARWLPVLPAVFGGWGSLGITWEHWGDLPAAVLLSPGYCVELSGWTGLCLRRSLVLRLGDVVCLSPGVAWL